MAGRGKRPSGWNVGHQLHFQQGDVILQLQFALFQAAQLQLVMVAIEYQQLDDGIEVAVFHVEFNQAPLYLLCIAHVLRSRQCW